MASEPDDILEALRQREAKLLVELERVRRAQRALTGEDVRPVVTAARIVSPSRPVGFAGGGSPSPVQPPRIKINLKGGASHSAEPDGDRADGSLLDSFRTHLQETSKTARVREIVTRYLMANGKWATSGELLPVLQRAGESFGTEAPQSKLAAFLANIKEFRNIKGHGYGLAEWPDPPDDGWKSPGAVVSLGFGDDDD